MKKGYCPLCGGTTSIRLQKCTVKKIKYQGDNIDRFERVICEHYPKSEVNSKAYERLNGEDQCFKGKYSCCNCNNRFYSVELDGFYCFFDYLDRDKKEMFYLKPGKDTSDLISIVVTYWVCNVCNAKIEVSNKSKI